MTDRRSHHNHGSNDNRCSNDNRDDSDESIADTIADTIVDDNQSIARTVADDDDLESVDSLLEAACTGNEEDSTAATIDDRQSITVRSPTPEKHWFERAEAIDHGRSRSRSPTGDIDRLFAAEVKYTLCQYHAGQYRWLHTDQVTVQGQRSFEEIVQEKTELIQNMAADDYDFKIGITYDPIQRWSLPGGPYCYDWEFMILLYAATTSEKEAPESSGRLEKRLIDTMWTLPRCHNKQNTGGLSPTPGRPHWCYCVFRKAEQLSSRDTMADTLFGKPIAFSMIERHRR